MFPKYQTPESQELMLQLIRELVDQDFDCHINEQLQEKNRKYRC
jgi:hypothetical protein